MKDAIEELILKIKNCYPSLERNLVSEIENIKLVEIQLPDSINGVYYCQDSTNVIALNKTLPECLKIETFWHEFYHYCLSVGNFMINNSGFLSIIDFSTKEEYRANLFTALLLVDIIYNNDNTYSIMERCDVSENIARIRLEYALKNEKIYF